MPRFCLAVRTIWKVAKLDFQPRTPASQFSWTVWKVAKPDLQHRTPASQFSWTVWKVAKPDSQPRTPASQFRAGRPSLFWILRTPQGYCSPSVLHPDRLLSPGQCPPQYPSIMRPDRLLSPTQCPPRGRAGQIKGFNCLPQRPQAN